MKQTRDEVNYELTTPTKVLVFVEQVASFIASPVAAVSRPP
jgi:hypothetical protein